MSFWLVVALLAIGFIGGAITWNQIDVKNVYKGKWKLKQRGRGNTQESAVELNLPPQTKREDRKTKRETKRNERKENRARKARS